MISINLLKESIYEEGYFSESARTLTIQNERQAVAGVLSYVEISTNGTFISLSNKILQEGCGIFQTENRDAGRISYRRDCDGLCLLEVSGRNILLIIEVKSSYNEVKKRAFEQLIASYVKVRSILQSIDGYNPVDYEEMGLVVSYPPSGESNSFSTSIIGIKRASIAPSDPDRLNDSYATKLRVDKEVTLDLNAYKVGACHVNPSLYSPTLHVKHVEVADRISHETINIDSYL